MVVNIGAFESVTAGRKDLWERGFLEGIYAQNLENCVEIQVDPQALPNDGHEDVGGDGDPDLRAHGVGRVALERFEPQVLLDPLEEESHLPAGLVQLGHGQGREREVAGEIGPCLALGVVAEPHATELARVVPGRTGIGQDDRLIAEESRAAGDRMGVEPPRLQVPSGPDHEHGSTAVEIGEAGEVEVPSVHDVDGAGLRKKNVEQAVVGEGSRGNPEVRRDIAMEIQKGMDLDGASLSSQASPGEERQAEIDGRGIEGVGGLVQLEVQRVARRVPASLGDDLLRESRVDPPVALLVGIGQRGTGDSALDAQVVESIPEGTKAGLDIAETLSVGQLGKGHTEEMIPATEVPTPAVPSVSRHNPPKGTVGKTPHELCEDGPALVHEALLAEVQRQDRCFQDRAQIADRVTSSQVIASHHLPGMDSRVHRTAVSPLPFAVCAGSLPSSPV